MVWIRRIVLEVHRRSLWQVCSIYLVGSWIGYQVILNLTQGVGLPAWVPAFAVVLFIIGLPIVLATAFVQEGLPAGSAGSGRRSRKRGRRHASRRSGSAAGAAESGGHAGATDGGRHHWFLTWQRAVLGGVVAFLLLGITAGGYMGVRNAGIGPFGALIAAGKLEERDRLLVADFAASASDIELADALTHALRIDLTQSPVVNVVEPRYTRELLERMGRDGGARVDAELAREAALRDGIKAYVTGEVSRAGRGYVLSALIVAADDGVVLAAFRENASDSTAVLDAVDRLSRKLRERIGESLRSVNRSAPLPAVTTASLDALRSYSRGVHALDRELDFVAGVRLLEDAIAADSTFGMAWRKLAVAYYNTGAGRERFAQAATKAYDLRDRMSPRERQHTIGTYHLNVTGDHRAGVEAYRTLLDIYPDDDAALNNLALLYGELGERDHAIEYYERAIAVDSMNGLSMTNLASEYIGRGRFEDADRLLDTYEARFGDTRDGVIRRVELAAMRGDYDLALAHARRLAELRRGDTLLRWQSEMMTANLLALRGQLERSLVHRREAVALALGRGNSWQPLQAASITAFGDVLLRGRPDEAVRRIDAVLAEHPLGSIPALDRPYRMLANAYAVAGGAERARQLLAELEREVPRDYRSDTQQEETTSEVLLAFGAADYGAALRAVDRSAELDTCQRCMAAWRALILDRLNDDAAVAAYERYLATPYQYFPPDVIFLAPAHERLAQLYAERGDVANAVQHAARFVELWSDADAELQPRVRAMRDYLRSVGER
jgi:eukaryotic-like serine/threonine-protein kinase